MHTFTVEEETIYTDHIFFYYMIDEMNRHRGAPPQNFQTKKFHREPIYWIDPQINPMHDGRIYKYIYQAKTEKMFGIVFFKLLMFTAVSHDLLKELHQLLRNISKYIWRCLKLFPNRMMWRKIHVQKFWRKICSPSSNLVRLKLKPEWTSEPTTNAATELEKSKNLLHNVEREWNI